MSTNDIFVDECGYTGPDLLNQEQPVFVLASLNVSEQEASDMKKKFFERVQARELKHSALSKRPAQQKMVLSFLHTLAPRTTTYKVSVAHKRYVLVAKLIDLVVEPLMHDQGINVYDRGTNIAMANVYFYCLPAFMGQIAFDGLLTSFQEVTIHRTKPTYDRLIEQINEGLKGREEVQELLSAVKVGLLSFGNTIFEYLDARAFDIAVSLTLELMDRWHQDIQRPLVLIHDKSSDMAAAKGFWDALVNPTNEPMIAGYDRRRMSFPIPVERTLAQDSHEWAGLQLADVLAGAMTRACKWVIGGEDPRDCYGRELWVVIQDVVEANFVWPSKDVTPADLGTTGANAMDPNEAISRILRKQRSHPSKLPDPHVSRVSIMADPKKGSDLADTTSDAGYGKPPGQLSG